MADDIDDLLDEVEKKYLEKGKQPVDSNTKSRYMKQSCLACVICRMTMQTQKELFNQT